METRARRQSIALGVLLVVLAAVVWWNMAGGMARQTSSPSAAPAAARPARPASTPPSAAALEVELGALRGPRPDPADGRRNPFRFEARAQPGPDGPPDANHAPAGAIGPDGRPVPGGGPAGPPPTPPIPLKFIGFVEEAPGHRRLAALSDGRFTYYGREGDIIEGRYRIVRIGLESIEMMHVDGRGPQTIRLSGS